MNPSATNVPFYKHKRIGTLHALHMSLGIPACDLLAISRQADTLYRLAKSITKSDGSIRNTYDALTPLKLIHQKIKNQILDHVSFPVYLTGSIKGCDYKTNATLHAQAKVVINEDIQGFFPSTSADQVFNIWHGFFGFDKSVAQCLTQLTTRLGELPQGAITSSFLANLVFWQDEPKLQANFAAQGLVYSRYVDDIAISSKSYLTSENKSDIVRHVYGMLLKHGYRAKRIKHDITTSAERMTVTKLAINTKPGLLREDRSKIRAIVQALERRAELGETLLFDKGPYAQAMGKVRHLQRFHPGDAAPLLERLFALKEQSTVTVDNPVQSPSSLPK